MLRLTPACPHLEKILPGKKIFVKNAICRFLLQPANSL